MPSPVCAASFAHNRLLALLLSIARERLLPYLEVVPLLVGKELYQVGQKIRYVYFPTHGLVSLVHVVGQGEAQVTTVGCEGVVGMGALMDCEHTPIHAIVQIAGSAYRLPSSLLKAELYQNSELQRVFLRYFHALLMQIAQIALCNRYHSIEQQLCRCLLLSSQHSLLQPLMLTQEQIAKLLGVRREGVTLAAGRLQQLRVICYHRGCIEILDRAKLERLACECYGALKNKAPQEGALSY